MVADVHDHDGKHWPVHLQTLAATPGNLTEPIAANARHVKQGEHYATWTTSVCVSIEILPCAMLANIAIVLARAEDTGNSAIEIIIQPSGAGPGHYVECATNANATGRTEFLGPPAPPSSDRGCPSGPSFGSMRVWDRAALPTARPADPSSTNITFPLLPNTTINVAACNNTYECTKPTTHKFVCAAQGQPPWMGPLSAENNLICLLEEATEGYTGHVVQGGLSQELCDTHYTAWETSEIIAHCGPCHTRDVPFPGPQHTPVQARTGTRDNPTHATEAQTRKPLVPGFSWGHCNMSRNFTVKCDVTCPVDCLFGQQVPDILAISQPVCHEQGRSNEFVETATRVQLRRTIETNATTNGSSCTTQKERQLDAFYHTGLSGWCAGAPRVDESVEGPDTLTLLIRPHANISNFSTFANISNFSTALFCDKALQQLTYCAVDPTLGVAIGFTMASAYASVALHLSLRFFRPILEKFISL